MSKTVTHILAYLLTVLIFSLGLFLIEHTLGKKIISSYMFLFGYAFFIFTKTHLLVNYLSRKLDVYIGQLYLAFSVYKLIFTFFYFMLLKIKTEHYTKPFLGIFMIIYFTLLIIEFLQYRKILN